MNEEPDPNSEQIDQESKPFNSVTYWLLGVCIFIVVTYLVTFSTPLILSSHRNPDRTEAINNAKQIGIALFTFQEEYGTYPNDETAKDLIENHPTYRKDLSGTSSNALLRQLIINSKNDRSEDMFKFRFKKSVDPDGNIKPGEILKKGECELAYISGLSTAGNPSRPVILAPLIPGTKKFDPEPFDGRAIVLRMDNSASTYPIHEDGHIYDKDGDILSPEHPIWGREAPDIRYPE